MNRATFSMVLLSLALFGAGCGASPAPTPAEPPPAAQAPVVPPTSAPMLVITHPSNGARVTDLNLTVAGTTDAETVRVNGKQALLENGAWNMPIALRLGDNFIRVEATRNGSSASAEINVVGVEDINTPTPAPAAKPTTAPKPTTTTKPKPPATAPAPTPTAPAPKPASVTFVSDSVQSSLLISQYGGDLRWSRSTLGANFKGYAIVKSTTDTSPYYPKTPVSIFYSDIGSTYWSDRNMEKGKTTYYRVCALALDDTAQCGNVISAKRQ